MADNYFRLVCFIVNICPELLRAFFIQLAKKDSNSSYTSLNAYLTQRRQDIDQLHKRKIIWTDQKNLIFPSHGTCNEADWDVTLLVTLITKLFPRPDWSQLESKMDDIRNTRNIIQHISNTANISDTDFKTHWGRLESAATALAQQVFTVTEQASFKTKIDELEKNCIPNLVECLRLWCEQFAKHNNDLRKELNDLKSETRHTNSILHNVTVKKPGPAGNGKKSKRFKVVDDILKRLQEDFKVKMRELPKNFDAPAEVLDIRTKLRDNHHVVVTGSYNSRYFETALAAIKEMDYNDKRCVVMQTSSDWRHIDADDVDFVLCIDPFGRISFEETKAKAMADIFKNMKETAEGEHGKSIHILIVTDITILTECKLRHYHDILDDEVKVFEATTEAQPADLTGVAFENVPVTNSTFSQEFTSLRELTEIFLQRYKDPSLSLDSDVLKSARDKFKSKKAIVLTGSDTCQRAAATVAFTSSYKPSECLLLTKADDVMLIDWQNTCLVIIDEFAGKYRYEENEVYKWYNMFDHLFNAITTGKINIVITCEQNKLKRCMDEISSHPLLEHSMELPDRVTTIKEEDNDQKAMRRSTRKRKALGRLEDRDETPQQKRRPLPRAPTPPPRTPTPPPRAPTPPPRALTSPSWERTPPLLRLPTPPPREPLPPAADVGRQWLAPNLQLDIDQGSLTAFGDSFTSSGQRETRATTSIIKSSTSSFVWHVTNETVHSIKFQGDKHTSYISGCCCLPSGEILLADHDNKRLKKLDINYNVVDVCKFPFLFSDVCYIGNNEAVVCSFSMLHIVDVCNMRKTMSVRADHVCHHLASHGNLVYISYKFTIYEYNFNGRKQRVLYTCDLYEFYDFALSDNGSKIHISSSKGLITIDSSGNHLYTLEKKDKKHSCICVDNAGHLLLYSNESESILQVSSDGTRILGVIRKLSADFPQKMFFDRRRSALVLCNRPTDHLTVLNMTKQLLD